MRRLAVPLLLFALAFTLRAYSASAFDAGSIPSVDTPDPTECTIDPRALEPIRQEYHAILTATPAADERVADPGPYVPPVGAPAGEAMTGAITTTVRGLVA